MGSALPPASILGSKSAHGNRWEFAPDNPSPHGNAHERLRRHKLAGKGEGGTRGPGSCHSASSSSWFTPARAPEEHAAKLEPLRRGVNEKRKVRFDYVDGSGRASARTVRPVCLTFWGTTWLATAWCELRRDFGSFRPDRMQAVELLEAHFEDEEGKDLAAFLENLRG